MNRADRRRAQREGGEAAAGKSSAGFTAKGGDNPRRVRGSIVGGAPREFGTALVDASAAVLLDDVGVVAVDAIRDGRRTGTESLAMTLAGRINKTEERASHLYLFDADGAAAVATELIGLASRHGGAIAEEFFAAFDRRMTALKTENALGPTE